MTGAVGWLLGAMMDESAGTVNLVGGSFSRSASGIQVVGYRLDNTLPVEMNNEADALSYVGHNIWGGGGYSPSSVECRMTMNSGTNFGGSALSTWLDLSVDRTWETTDSTLDGVPVTGTGTIELRDASTLVVLDSATVTLTAERTL